MPLVNFDPGRLDYSLTDFFGCSRQAEDTRISRTQVGLSALITFILGSIATYSMSECEKVTVKDCLLPIVLVTCSSGMALLTFCLAAKACNTTE